MEGEKGKKVEHGNQEEKVGVDDVLEDNERCRRGGVRIALEYLILICAGGDVQQVPVQ